MEVISLYFTSFLVVRAVGTAEVDTDSFAIFSSFLFTRLNSHFKKITE